MNKFEYYCCWLDVYNCTALQDFLDERGKQGWEVIHLVPDKNNNNYNTLFVFKRVAIEVIEKDKY